MMIRPQPRLVMAGTAALVTRKAEVRLRARAACQVTRSMDSTVPDSNTGSAAEIMPALLTTMSSRPHCSSAADTRPDATPPSRRAPVIPAASKPRLRSSLTLSLLRGGVETDAVGAARPGDPRHPAGQVKRRWDGHCPILVGPDARSPGTDNRLGAIAPRAAALLGTEQDADHDGTGTRPVLPVVRDARLLDDRVARAQHDLASADDERDLAAQDRDVVQRAGGVRAVELRVLGFGLSGRALRIVARRYLDDPEAGPAGRRLECPLPRGGVGVARRDRAAAGGPQFGRGVTAGVDHGGRLARGDDGGIAIRIETRHDSVHARLHHLGRTRQTNTVSLHDELAIRGAGGGGIPT